MSSSFHGNIAIPQVSENVEISKPPILVAMPFLGPNPYINPVVNPGSSMDSSFPQNYIPVIPQGGTILVPSTFKPSPLSSSAESDADKTPEENVRLNTLISLPHQQLVPCGQPLQFVQAMPAYQPNSASVSVIKYVPQ